MLSTRMSAVAAGVLAEKYQATGAKLDVSINENWAISPSFLLSQSHFYDRLKGSKAELSSNILLPAQLTMGVSASQFSGGFRELTEAMDEEAQTYENNWNASLTWNNEYIGAISMQYSVNSGDENSGDSRYLMASWSKSLGRTSLSVNWQHAMSNSDTQNQSSTSRDDDLFYVSLIVPFGEDRVSTYMRAQGKNKIMAFRKAALSVKTLTTTSLQTAIIRIRVTPLTAISPPTFTIRSSVYPLA
jgi:outer membrane usher protein FimD/PapC